MTNSAAHSSTRVVLIALAVNIAIAASKAFAAVLTGSSAMLSETVHSCVDCINQVLMLVGIKRSTQPADDLHPLGYDREIYFWSVVVSVAVFAGGGMAAWRRCMTASWICSIRRRSPELRSGATACRAGG